MRRLGTAWLALLAIGVVPAQQWRRHVEDLGSAGRGEAAELALIDLGSKVVPALESVFDEWDLSTAREYDRLVAALRIVDILGERAGALQAQLAKVVTSERPGDLRGPQAQFLLPAVLQALGSTTPYITDIEFHTLFHHAVVSSSKDDKAAVFRAIFRFSRRQHGAVGSIEEARARLADDKLFAREVAAEWMMRSGTMTDAVLLRDRLLDRETRPEGWDALKHNGFVVPSDDDFALRAARTLVHIAPDDAVSAIGYAILAEAGPHRSRRMNALRSLARFGPDVAAATPELVAIATGDDVELAAEALKVLGMGGRAAGGHLATIDGLRGHSDANVARRARSLGKMLRAMGCELPRPDPAVVAAEANRRAIAVAVGTLADADTEVVSTAEELIAEAADLALPLLVERLRAEAKDCPDRVIEWVARLGRKLPRDERMQLCHALATTGDRWAGPRFSSSSGGGAITKARALAYGTLWVGPLPQQVQDVVALLQADNVAVRLAAARELAARPDLINATEASEVTDALWVAVSGEHPEKSTFQRGRGKQDAVLPELPDELRAAAAGALIPTAQPTERHAELLRHALRHPSAAVAARAIVTWGSNADLVDLEQAASDPRPAVAEAAKAALDRRDPR